MKKVLCVILDEIYIYGSNGCLRLVESNGKYYVGWQVDQGLELEFANKNWGYHYDRFDNLQEAKNLFEAQKQRELKFR